MTKTSSLTRAVDHIKANWQQGQSLKQVAAKFGVDAGNLDRAFREQEGMTIKQSVDQKRKEYVLSRLTSKTILGYAIGAELGFANDLAFYRWVKRAFGVSFTALRAQTQRHVTTGRHDKK